MGRLLAAVAAVAVVTGCTTSVEHAPPPAPTRSEAGLEPLGLPDEPAWTFDAASFLGARVRAGTVLIDQWSVLDVVDAATGAVRWSVRENAELRGGRGARWGMGFDGRSLLVGDGADLAVLTEYQRHEGEDTERGVALLSAADGRVRWLAPLVPAGAAGAHAVPDLWATDGETVLVSVSPGAGTVTTFALDVVDGERLWEVQGVWPVAIAGDTAVTVTSATAPRPDLGLDEPDGHPEGRDLATGEPRWQGVAGFDDGSPMLVAGDVVLVRGTSGGGTRTVVVEAATGRMVTEIGTKDDLGNCATDGRSIACQGYATPVVTFSVGDRTMTTSDRTVPGIDAVARGRVFVRDVDLKHFTIDVSGDVVDRDLPGDLLAIEGDLAVFVVEDRLSAYRLPI